MCVCLFACFRTCNEEHLVLAGELDDGEGEVARVGGQETSGSDVPSDGGGEDTKRTTGGLDLGVAGELGDEEEQESDVEEEEEGDQTHRRSERGHEHDEGEDEPGTQVDTDGIGNLSFGHTALVVGALNHAEPGDLDDGVTPPESAVTREGGSTESVTCGKLPHSGEELGNTTVADGETDNDVGNSDAASLDVVHGQDKGGGGEAKQTQRRGVGESTMVDGEGGLRGVLRVSSRGEGTDRLGTALVAVLLLLDLRHGCKSETADAIK